MGKPGLVWGLVVLLIVGAWPQLVEGAMGVQGAAEIDEPDDRTRLEMELEYLAPVDGERQIKTVLANIFRIQPNYSGGRWSYYPGLTFTKAWGRLDWENSERDTSACGVGPVFLIRRQLWRRERLTLWFDSSVGLIFYSEDFPAGGDFYNFMWRIGPKLMFKITDRSWLSIGYKLMHVSNGQLFHHDFSSHNPAYNAAGVSLSLIRWL
jgi:lipid A 3-O-deacylase